ncbi:MAG: glucose-6-phosphate dehydrogenase [Desulfomonile tiedjei]|nr:glucose-6-phosphate dehydrogenase [Desulfomonile tiedjei]
MDLTDRKQEKPVAVAESHVPDLKVSRQGCLAEQPPEPCIIVIFGVTGDLASRKLAPAFYKLYLSGGLPSRFAIVGCARHPMDHDQFREHIKKAVGESDKARWEEFAASLFYHRLHFDSADSYAELGEMLHALDEQHSLGGNKIFYLAVPPSLYKDTARMLGEAGFSREGVGGNGWARLVVEKPFGRDLPTAVDLNVSLQQHWQERQIFRIDHYIAKETVQNVLMFRFANTIFEPLWNRMFIDRVFISAAESLGVEKRAAYYEDAGVLRDMFQNHMMQLLAVTAMEPPSRFEAEPVRDEKSKVFGCLMPFQLGSIDENLVLGQYGPGTIDGIQVPGYREEPGVNSESATPTFAMMRVFVGNWRWEGVPFYLMSGKRLERKVTEIVIHFKQVPHLLFTRVLEDRITPNVLTLGIQPDEKITLTFETKNPGATICLRSVTMDFNYAQNYGGPTLDAYEKALLDCMQGDQTLLWRQDAVEMCWSFLDPVLEWCETCAPEERCLLPYEAGSWGPETAEIWPNRRTR